MAKRQPTSSCIPVSGDISNMNATEVAVLAAGTTSAPVVMAVPYSTVTTGLVYQGMTPLVMQYHMPHQGPYQNPPYTGTAVYCRQPIPTQYSRANTVTTSSVAESQARWVDEQQRLKEKFMKDRNYQIQQQKLKDTFHSSGGQKLQADTLIQNMFGKLNAPTKRKDIEATSMATASVSPNSAARMQSEHDSRASPSNVSGFQSSQKARDWSNLGDLQSVFSAPSSGRLPPWCQEGAAVPALYKQVEGYVTRGGVIDTTVLYPILVSSGLSRETLGHIWAVANQHMPGMLTPSELYAVLALIALAQNACQITSLDILHTVTQPPIPLLNQVTAGGRGGGGSGGPTNAGGADGRTAGIAVITTCQAPVDDEFDDFKSASSIVPSITIPPSSNDLSVQNSIGNRLANYDLSLSPRTSSSSSSITKPSVSQTVKVNDSDDFSDFQQAADDAVAQESIALDAKSISPCEGPRLDTGDSTEAGVVKQSPPAATDASASFSSDLMSTDGDKYSVFRELIFKEVDLPIPAEEPQKTDVEFGDFLRGSVDTDAPPLSRSEALSSSHASGTSSNISAKQSEVDRQNLEFCDFHSFDLPTVVNVNTASTGSSLSSVIAGYHGIIEAPSSEDNDFGDFISPSDSNYDSSTATDSNNHGVKGTAVQQPPINHNFLNFKDTISVESQSVASLDLGTLDMQSDGECHAAISGGERKVDNDIYVDVDEEVDQSVPAGERTDSSKSGTSGHLRSSISGGSAVLDRYSLILDSHPGCDIHSFEWQRCLDSCYELITNTLNIFNGISSSDVSNEVISSEEGENYLKNIMEVYRISRRISTSLRKISVSPKLESKVKAIESEWNKLVPFFIGSPVYESAKHNFDPIPKIPHSVSNNNVNSTCGVCLLAIDVADDRPVNTKIAYGGRNYHSSCANFWVNCVDSLLPTLPVN